MACMNLVDFKSQIEGRFEFWDNIRRVLDQTRVELEIERDQKHEWAERYPTDDLVLHQITTSVHQCLRQAVEQYSESLRVLEEMEISENKESQKRKGLAYEEISEYTSNT